MAASSRAAISRAVGPRRAGDLRPVHLGQRHDDHSVGRGDGQRRVRDLGEITQYIGELRAILPESDESAYHHAGPEITLSQH
ncbi:hypothetical protein ACFQZ4_28955 [Catellatospora coxensis]